MAPSKTHLAGGGSSRNTSRAHLGLVLSAIYLNISLDSAKASDHHEHGYGEMQGGGENGYLPPIVIPPGLWPEFLTRLATAGAQQGFFQGGGRTGFRDNTAYYDDLFSHRNAFHVGKGYGNGLDYGRGSIVGGGYRNLGGRNKGHTASGFSNSYRKDESGDRSSYYDDGLGHNGKITYGAHDARYRDQGGHLGRGGYHKSNLKRYGGGDSGRYADSLGYTAGRQAAGGYGGGYGAGYGGGYGGGYGAGTAYRHGRLLGSPPNRTGLYVIPVPPKLFFDLTLPRE